MTEDRLPLAELLQKAGEGDCCCSRRASEQKLCASSAYQANISRTVRVDAVAEGRPRPRQHQPRLQLALPTAAHALGDQRALILRDRAADLQQQLVMRVLAHGRSRNRTSQACPCSSSSSKT